MVFKPLVKPTFEDLSYIKNGHVRQRLDIYYPPLNGSGSLSSASASGSGNGPTHLESLTPGMLADNKYRYPLVVYIHGGAFRYGSRKSDFIPWHILQRTSLNHAASNEAQSHGELPVNHPDDVVGVDDSQIKTRPSWAIASIDYRLSGDATFPAAVQDCIAAIRFLRANCATFSLDPDCFVVWGESAGAHCACMVGALSAVQTRSAIRNIHPDHRLTSHGTNLGGVEVVGDDDDDEEEKEDGGEEEADDGTIQFSAGDYLDVPATVQGVIDYYGPTDFSLMDNQLPPSLRNLPTAEGLHNSPDSPESLYLGKQITLIPEIVQQANPITYVRRAVGRGLMIPPFLIAHGTLDQVVAYGQSEVLRDAIVSRDGSGATADVRISDCINDNIKKGGDSGGMGRVKFIPMEGAGHCFLDASDDQIQTLDRMTLSWLDSLYFQIPQWKSNLKYAAGFLEVPVLC